MYGNSSYVGYDADAIKAMFTGLGEAYEQLIDAVGGDLQNQVINPIGEFWYSKEAQETGEAVTSVVNGQFTDAIRDTYDGIIGYLDGVAINWADLTHNAHVANTYGNATRRFDTRHDAIKEMLDNTFVGINEDKSLQYTQNLPAVKASIVEKIADTYSKIRNLTPFVGAGQEEALQKLFNKLNDTVNDMFSFIIDGSGNFKSDDVKFQGMKKAMEDWTTEYKERARRAAQAIGGDGTASA